MPVYNTRNILSRGSLLVRLNLDLRKTHNSLCTIMSSFQCHEYAWLGLAPAGIKSDLVNTKAFPNWNLENPATLTTEQGWNIENSLQLPGYLGPAHVSMRPEDSRQGHKKQDPSRTAANTVGITTPTLSTLQGPITAKDQQQKNFKTDTQFHQVYNLWVKAPITKKNIHTQPEFKKKVLIERKSATKTLQDNMNKLTKIPIIR
ncbi:hypothetical protein BB561_006147 [Smittium simulii]|uniref:Uncharacterized protein n=1 Tax=Smittium simulii TaxID=133385 RepID=A0A2T9Y6A1_9FUNG|nr:hypothetical protein BB561_006147 [Smittium simulii]